MAISLDLSERIALVTGGAKGVGLGITERLLDAGATVVVCGRNEPEVLPDDVTFVTADVRDADSVAALVARVVADHGGLDVVVNNAGGSPAVAAADTSPRLSEKVIALNLTGALHVCHATYPSLRARRGCIVNISSMSGMRASPQTAAYGAAKAGLLNLTRTLALEWAPEVRVNAVSAGIVRTEMFEDYYGGPEGAAAVSAVIPMGRPAEASEVGDAVAFLASPLAGYVSGANLEVNGGGEWLTLSGHIDA